MTDLTNYLQRLLKHEELSKREAASLMELMLNNSNSEQIAAILSILQYRGETIPEIIGMYETLYAHSSKIDMRIPVLDIVGTGGDYANTVNISTGSAILTAACGIPVVKHGNRSVSSLCGSADVLEALGVDIEMPFDKLHSCFNALNIAFLYAPRYHQVLSNMRKIRKSLSISSIFNHLGPLLNPANAQYLLIGIANESMLEKMSDVLLEIKTIKQAFIYHGSGLDELSTLGTINGFHIQYGRKNKIQIHPEELGFSICKLNQLQGGSPQTNATLLKEALSGSSCAISDSLVLNAGTAIMVYGKTNSIQDGIHIAKKVLNEGKAMSLLNQWIELSTLSKQERQYDSA